MSESGACFGLVDKVGEIAGSNDRELDVTGSGGLRGGGGNSAQGVGEVRSRSLDTGRLRIRNKIGDQAFDAGGLLKHGI